VIILKLAIVSDTLPPNECSMHSLIPYVIAHVMYARGIDVVLVGKSQCIGLRSNYVDIHVVSSPNSISRMWSLAMQIAIILGELAHEDIDVFHAFGLVSSLATLYVAQAHSIPFIYTPTTYPLGSSLEVLSTKAIEDKIMNSANAIVIFDEIGTALSSITKNALQLSIQDTLVVKKLEDLYRGLIR